MPPQPIHFFDEGKLSPHVCEMIGTRDTYTYKKTYEPNCDEKTPVKLFAKGFEYTSIGLPAATQEEKNELEEVVDNIDSTQEKKENTSASTIAISSKIFIN